MIQTIQLHKICQKSPWRVVPLRHQDSPLCSRDWALAVFLATRRSSQMFRSPKVPGDFSCGKHSAARGLPVETHMSAFWKDNLLCTQLNCWSKTMVWEEIKESKMSNLLLLIINNKRFITNFHCTTIYLNIFLASSCNILHCSRTAHPSRTAPLEPTCTGLCEIEVATSVLHLRWSGIPNRHTSHLMSGMPQAPFASRRSWSFKLIFGAKSWKEFLSTQKMQPKQCIVEIFKEAQWDTLLKMRFLAVSTSRRTAIIFNKKSNHWQKTQLRSQHQHLDIQGWEHWYPPKKKTFFCWRCLKPSSSTEKWISAFHTATKFVSFILAMVSPPKAACARLSRSCSTSSRSWNNQTPFSTSFATQLVGFFPRSEPFHRLQPSKHPSNRPTLPWMDTRGLKHVPGCLWGENYKCMASFGIVTDSSKNTSTSHLWMIFVSGLSTC